MATKPTTELEIQLDDKRVIVARPRPEDEERMVALIGSYETVNFSLAEGDVSGHALVADVGIDLEGHAFTLRLPTPADAEALRKALLIGAMSATVVAAGALAAAVVTPGAQAPAAPQAGPARNVDLAVQREHRLSELEAAPAAPVHAIDTTGETSNPRRPTSGELEFDR